MANSVSIIADAFNNLSDAGSSVISLIGSHLAGKRADEDHPFGHGRIEYLAAFMVSFIIVLVGFETLRNAFQKLLHPEELSFGLVPVLVLVLSILAKLGMGLFYRSVARKIDSSVYEAASQDSFMDMLTTGTALSAILIYGFFHVNLDAIIGLLVSGLVIWNGIGIARDTIEPLIGMSIDPKLYYMITEFVRSYDGIYDTHDLIVHNYGPSRYMASIHASVKGSLQVSEAHDIIDRIEQDADRELNILLLIHMDPYEDNEELHHLGDVIQEVLARTDARLSSHDLRLHRLPDGQTRQLSFDLVTPWDAGEEQVHQLLQRLEERLTEEDPELNINVTLDKPYMHVHSEREDADARNAGHEALEKLTGRGDQEQLTGRGEQEQQICGSERTAPNGGMDHV